MVTREDVERVKKGINVELIKFKREGLDGKGTIKLLLGEKERQVMNSDLFDTTSDLDLTNEQRKEIVENPNIYSIELIYTNENSLLQGCLVL